MPSHRLYGNDVTLALFDVLGQNGEIDFIQHTGLATKMGCQNSGAVEVCHMGPPLDRHGEMKADVRGVADLNDDERRKVQRFVDLHVNEHATTQKLRGVALMRQATTIYCIHPHAMPHKEKDGRYTRMRFSCAGFVFEAYRKARIVLVDKSHLPSIKLDRLKQAYPEMAEVLESARFRESMGLSDVQAWPVMLCGYLLHSLNREAEEIRRVPYVPRSGDAYFT